MIQRQAGQHIIQYANGLTLEHHPNPVVGALQIQTLVKYMGEYVVELQFIRQEPENGVTIWKENVYDRHMTLEDREPTSIQMREPVDGPAD